MVYIYMLLSLAITCYDEAGGRGHDAMSFVADTVINRVHNGRFPNTVTGVIYQPGQFAWASKHKHKTLDDLRLTKAKMIKKKDPHNQHQFIWLDAMDIAAKSLAPDYKPKTHALYFSSKTINAHSYSYHHKR